MIKFFVLSGLLIVASAMPAQAGYKCDGYGNCYWSSPSYDGGTTLYGNNYSTGSSWNTRIKKNGDMSGFDSNGNFWNYDASSGAYWNSDGTHCYGTGAFRNCN